LNDEAHEVGTEETPRSTSPKAALTISNISHWFKEHQAVKDISFSVPAQSIHGFVGPNGAGKTTTLKIIATLLRQKKGSVKVFNYDTVEDVYKVRQSIGFMPDHFSMYRQMSVFEYLDFFAAAYGLNFKDRNQIIDSVLALTDMGNRQDDLIQGLSRGMQQRVSLARILVNDPKLLLLDEPASGLDPRARIELMEIIRELRNMGKTIFISSHILSELADLCDSVTIIDRGEIRYSGSMDNLLRKDGAQTLFEVHLQTIIEGFEARLTQIPGITKVVKINDLPQYTIQFEPGQTNTSSILQGILATGANIRLFKESQRQLNQVFMDLTKPGVRS
jgi:ABC-2 type transport system ATP-binding protein